MRLPTVLQLQASIQTPQDAVFFYKTRCYWCMITPFAVIVRAIWIFKILPALTIADGDAIAKKRVLARALQAGLIIQNKHYQHLFIIFIFGLLVQVQNTLWNIWALGQAFVHKLICFFALFVLKKLHEVIILLRSMKQLYQKKKV